MKLRKIANLNLILPHRRQCLKEIVFKVTGVSVIIIGETSSGVPRLCDVLSSHSFDEKLVSHCAIIFCLNENIERNYTFCWKQV